MFSGVGNASVDFVALRDGELVRVEVKTASVKKLVSGDRLSVTRVSPKKFDMLLVVCPDGSVLQNPPNAKVTGSPYGEKIDGRATWRKTPPRLGEKL